MATTCLIAFGANLENPRDTFDRTVAALDRLEQSRLTAVSTPHITAPVGGPARQPPFVNAVLRLDTHHTPLQLHARLQEVEYRLGRRPGVERWGPRVVDLDLLLYGRMRVETPSLQVPHPRLSFRRFVLEPAAEVGAEIVHPELMVRVGDLLDHLNSTIDYVAVVGPDPQAAAAFVQEVCSRAGAIAIRDPVRQGRSDAAGRRGTDEIEFLRARTNALVSAVSGQPAGRFLMSDFWCDESRMFLSRGSRGQRSTFERHWSQSASQRPRAKLVVLLDEPRDGSTAADFREGMFRYLRTHPCGPLLPLSLVDREWAIHELLAAMDAMQEPNRSEADLDEP